MTPVVPNPWQISRVSADSGTAGFNTTAPSAARPCQCGVLGTLSKANGGVGQVLARISAAGYYKSCLDGTMRPAA